ncbi:MAG: pectate lyase, partial [Bacteroidales bacterium]|nr:pectate lyase [Bacteroidales bacterium]
GRGGTVYHVTTLEDDGNNKGSLRWALKQSGAKIIVFDVSGYIDLQEDLYVRGNTTIAGQTAPGEGITLRYRTVVLNKEDNIIIRFVRFRRSQVKDVNEGADAIWGRQKSNIILDHCSFSWSIDEIASFYDNRNFTMQWCNLTEALANPGHPKGEHSYGGIWGGKGASFHHNFLAHMQNRVPRFNGARYQWDGYDKTKYENTVQAEQVDLRNCVMYNWGTGGCYGGPGGGYVNMINNYYKAGPGTVNKTRVTQVSVGTKDNAKGYPDLWGYSSRYYIRGNYVEAAGKSAENYDWKGVVYDSGLSEINDEKYIPDTLHLYGQVDYVKNSQGYDCVRVRLDNPIEAGEVTTHAATVAYEKVLAYAGASLWRDAADARYEEEARTGTCTFTGTVTNRAGVIDLVNDPSGVQDTTLASFPPLTQASRPTDFDTDRDGMPDKWEEANGLDRNNASDGKLYTLDTEHGWYTNLEVYLNGLVEHIVRAGNEDAVSAVDEYYPPQNRPSAIENPEAASPAILSVEYYTLDGKKLSAPCQGIMIRRIRYHDGSVFTDKVIKY